MTLPFTHTSGYDGRKAGEYESAQNPRRRHEGFLLSDHTEKANARIDFTVRVPRDPLSLRPVIIVPGFGGIKPVYGEPRDALAEVLQRPVATYRHPRSEKTVRAGFTMDKFLHPDKLGGQSVVAMIDKMLELFGVDSVDIVGHSMGGPNGIDGTLRRLGKVGKVVLVGSGGLEEDQSSFRLARRGKAILQDEISPAVRKLATEPDALNIAAQSLFHMARNPLRTAGEMMAISNRPFMYRELHLVRAAGVEVHAVQLAEDRFFPLYEATRHTPGVVDGYHVIEGMNHMGPILESERFANALVPILGARAVQASAA